MLKNTVAILLGVVLGGCWSKPTKYFTKQVLVASPYSLGRGWGTAAGKYKNNANASAKAPLLSVHMKY